MATMMNAFELLLDNDNEDPSQLIVAKPTKPAEKPKKPASAPVQATKPAAKLPSKPLPPTQVGELLFQSID